MNESYENKQNLLPYEMIVAATCGDTDAINEILNYYHAYIVVLSTRHLFDEFGNRYEYVDEEKRQMIEIQLITKILTFRYDQIV